MPWRDNHLLIFLTSQVPWQCFCEVFRKTSVKTVSGSGTIAWRSEQLHKECVSKATAAASAQVSNFCFQRAIPGIKLSRLVFSYSRYNSRISLTLTYTSPFCLRFSFSASPLSAVNTHLSLTFFGSLLSRCPITAVWHQFLKHLKAL